MDDNFKREILLEHYQNPRNKGLKRKANYLSFHNTSDSCIDDITVELCIEDDIIKEISFDGVGCTISTASTSIFTELLMNKSLKQAEEIIQNYYNMLNEKAYDEDLLEEANAFNTLYKQANRLKCGTIGIKAIEHIIKEYNGKQ